MSAAGETSAVGRLPDRVRALFDEQASLSDAAHLRHLYRALAGEQLDSEDSAQLAHLSDEYGIEPGIVLRLEAVYNECVELAAGERLDAGEILYARRPFKPHALDAAIDAVAATKLERLHARALAGKLRGRDLPPPAEAEDLRRGLGLSQELFDVAATHYRMAILTYRSSRAMRHFRRGHRRRQQIRKMSLAAPHAVVRRMPGVTNNQFDGPIGGTKPVVDRRGRKREVQIRDVYGPIWCNEPLRMGAMGTLFYILGVASHPSRFRRYGQIDDGRVLASQGRIYEAIAQFDEGQGPGGGGHACVRYWIDQLDRLEISATEVGDEAVSEFAPDMSIPSSPIGTVEKLVLDDDDQLQWVSWSDPRPIVTSAEFTLRFTVAEWCLRRMGTTDDHTRGDRVLFNPDVWRCLRPEGQAMYMVVQGGVANEAKHSSHRRAREIKWYAADPWCLRFGWADLPVDEREDKILLGLNDLYHVDKRLVGYARPWDGHNGPARDFAVFVQDGSVSEPREAMRPKIRLAQLRALLREFDDAGVDGVWPGRVLAPAGNDPPPRDP